MAEKERASRQVIVISLITAACLIGDSMLYIVLPICFAQAGLSSLWEVGIILSVNRLVRLPLNPMVGWLYRHISDRTGIFIATVLATITTFSYAFADGFAKKVAKGLDLMAFHGINPRTGSASGVIGTNHFDSKVTQAVTIATGDKPDANVEAAIALVQGAERDVTGMVLSPSFKSALAAQTTTDGAKLYPQLAWGAKPGEVNGLRVESTSNLSAGSSLDRALVGDFTNCFKWGYAKEMPIEVIQYGNPDNDADLGDLKGHNQVYLRGEAYIGWGILDPSAFAHIKANA